MRFDPFALVLFMLLFGAHGAVAQTCGASSASGFLDPLDKTAFSWPETPGALVYEAARAADPLFATACETFETSGTNWSDPTIPPPGAVLFYLDRVVDPAGDWGIDSTCVERALSCGCSGWPLVIGGSGDEHAASAITVAGGDIVLASTTNSFGAGGDDLLISRLRDDGELVWSRTFGAAGDEQAADLVELADSSLAIFGRTRTSAGGDWDFQLTRISAQGVLLSQRRYGGPADETPDELILEPSGELFMSGATASFGGGGVDAWTVRVDGTGSVTYQRALGESGDESGRVGVVTSDGGLLIGGATDSTGAGGDDVWLLRSDALGSPLWSVVFGGSSDEVIEAAAEASDGGFILAGSTRTTDREGWLARVDANGALTWQQSLGGLGDQAFRSVAVDPTGGFVAIGDFESSDTDVWMVKVDGQGAVSWQRRFGASGEDRGFGLLPAPGGGWTVFAQSDSFSSGDDDLLVLRVDADGRLDPSCPLEAATSASVLPTAFTFGLPLQTEKATTVSPVATNPTESSVIPDIDSPCPGGC